MNQRGVCLEDIRLVTSLGTWTGDHEVFLSRHDAAAEINRLKKEIAGLRKQGIEEVQHQTREFKRLIQNLERLEGCKVVIIGRQILTCYHTTKKHQKQMLRFARACAA